MHKFSYQSFYTNQGIETLHKSFVEFLNQHTEPKTLVEKAIVLEKFLSQQFQIEEKISHLREKELNLQKIFHCKRRFVQRHVVPLYKAPLSNDSIILRQELSTVMGVPFDGDELLFASHILRWLDNKELYKDQLEKAERYAAWALFSEEGQTFHRHGVLFHLPQPLDFEALFPLRRRQDQSLESVYQIERKGFDCTDQKPQDGYAQDQAQYCLTCHRQQKDSCRKGLDQKINPLGEPLTGCPLDQKISEMMEAKQQGHTLAALAIITIDNPMVAATGRRICNACSKACIFQKQTPVDVPSVETEILEAVLDLPWGFELYSLLTRWNPLRETGPLPAPSTHKKVLVVGMGPAGFALSHHLLNDGHTVVGIDGLTIHDLPPALKEPKLIKNIKDFFEPLDNRQIKGFGGVADYGITARWNKNFLLIIRLILERHPQFMMLGNTRLESTLTTEQAFDFGFDHIALCMGAGKPNVLDIPNSLAPGVMQANDFLMRLHVQGLSQKNGGYPLLLQSPIVVIGSGLTAVDAATEAKAYYALQDNREPDSVDVKILYRKTIQESPAYRKNYEELKNAMEEGVGYLENKNPQEFLVGADGRIQGILCRDGTTIPAKTVLMALGTNPQTVIAEENPNLFQKEGLFLSVQKDHSPFTTTLFDADRFVSFLGDLHPSFSGSVVHALASAKKAAPCITEKLLKHSPFSTLSTHEFFNAFKDQIIPRVQHIERKEDCTRLKIRAPLAAKNLNPGQFFRLQILTTPTTLETIPLMAVPSMDREAIHFSLKHSKKTDAFLKNLSLGAPISLMGPTGNSLEIPTRKTVLLIGEPIHNETLEFIGHTMKKKGCRVLYNEKPSVDVDEVFVIDPLKNNRTFLEQFSETKISNLVPTSMYCMMKGICAQCLRLSKDPKTGKEVFVFGCQKSIDRIDAS